jgi:hypothetical protein
MTDFKYIVTDGTEAKQYTFTGKLVATITKVHIGAGLKRTTRLYELPDGYYRVVYYNGNVSSKSPAHWVREQHPDLARLAGLVEVIELD